jgi:hypothetical protein
MAVSVITSAVGFRELAAKTKQDPPFFHPAIKGAQRRLANSAAKRLRARATKGPTGQLRRSIRPRTSGRGLFAAVAFNPIASQGRGKGADFRSGWAFDKSSKFKPRNGGFTKGWISQVPPDMQGEVASELETAGKEIEAAWDH